MVSAAVAALAGVALSGAVAAPAFAAQGLGVTVSARHTHAAAPRQSPAPAAAMTPMRWAHVAGFLHTCAITTGSTLWCWGLNQSGQLGLGNTTETEWVPRPVTVPARAGWTSITAGTTHTCAIRTGGTLWCWGQNDGGELGLGNTTNQDLPQPVTVPARAGWASVTGGDGDTCAIRTGGTLWCWGGNDGGQLGTGNTTSRDLPQQVTTPARGGWVSVSAGTGFACAIHAGGSLWCWGHNEHGELGIGNTTNQDLPRQVTTPTAGGWSSVTTGVGHTCAIHTGGTLWCWGTNGFGQLGIGTTTGQDLPEQVLSPAPSGWGSVAADQFHTCAIRASSTLWCWGLDGYGELGIGNTTDQHQPHQVTTPARGGWATVVTGFFDSCAIRTNSTLWCWGNNEEGQLGTGSTSGSQDRPVQVPGCQPAAQAPAARAHPLPAGRQTDSRLSGREARVTYPVTATR
jgi:alpha-tubulin suppressor-like RCC1 family protein